MFQFYTEINSWLKLLMIIPLISGIVHFKKLDFPLKLLFYYVIFDIVIITITGILRERNMNNLLFINLFIVVEFYLISSVFSLIIENKVVKRIIKTSYLLFASLILFTFVYYQLLNEYANHLILFESFFFIVFTSTYLFSQIKQEKDILNDPYAWFSIAVLMYFITTFLVYASFHKLAKLDKTVFMQVWLIKNGFMYLYFIIIAIAFYKQAKLSASEQAGIEQK